MTEKKRKRESESNGKPRKRPSVGFAADDLKISFLRPSGNELPPVLAVSSALPQKTFALKPYIKPARESSSRKDEFLLHSSDHPRLDYTGREEYGGGVDNLLKHYVGVYDPESGELQLVEAKRIAIKPVLRATAEELRKAKDEKAYKTPAMLRQSLGMEFGTKRAKKAIQSQAENAVLSGGKGKDASNPKEDAINKAFLDSIAVSAAAMPSREAMVAAIADSIPRPKANLEATIPDEVYPLEVLIGNDTLQLVQVDDWLELFAKKKDIKTRSRYVSSRLRAVLGSKDKTKIKALRFVLVLIEFWNLLNKSFGRSKRVPKFKDLQEGISADGTLINNIRTRFTTNRYVSKSVWNWYGPNRL
jgi:DNA-directed RNA polymerase I subunit RPA49